MNPKDPPVSVPGAWIIGMHYTYLYVGAGGGQTHILMLIQALHLPTKPSPSSLPMLFIGKPEECGVSS